MNAKKGKGLFSNNFSTMNGKLPDNHVTVLAFAQKRQSGKVYILLAAQGRTVDLDNFKQINDTMGHLAGDEVLRQVADVLKDVAGPENLVGRVGGDEFVVFVKTEQDRARETAEKILAGIQNITVEGRNSTRISGSVGIAIAPRDGRDYYALLKRADACLYQAKSEGKDRWYGEKEGQENI